MTRDGGHAALCPPYDSDLNFKQQRRHCERSEAIHASARGKMDCFVAALLAMTNEHTYAFPRHRLPESCKFTTLAKRAQGMPDAWSHPQPCVQVKKARKQVTTGTPKQSGTPCAMVLAAASYSPWCAGLDSHHHRRNITASLIPASGNQDHTTWPSALALLVSQRKRVHRIPRSTFVTTRTPLLMSAGQRYKSIISDFRKQEYF